MGTINTVTGPKQKASQEVEYLALNSIFSQQRCSIQVEIIKILLNVNHGTKAGS